MAGIGALIKDIKSLDEWDAMLKASAGSNLVVVLDVYIDWAGPCNVMQFFFDRLVMDEVDIEHRVVFYSVEQKIVADQIKEILPRWSTVNIDTKGCCPLFLFLEKGEMVAEVSGCDSPAVMRAIKEYMPPPPEHKKEDHL